MFKKGLFIITLLVVVVISFFIGIKLQTAFFTQTITVMGTAIPSIPTLNPESVARGERIYDQYCASCHGSNLEGVPNWKEMQSDGSYLPPPHDSSGHTWHHPDRLLIEIITNGGDPDLYNTKMPAFGGQLMEKEIIAVIDYIKSSWMQEEREFQWWVTFREE